MDKIMYSQAAKQPTVPPTSPHTVHRIRPRMDHSRPPGDMEANLSHIIGTGSYLKYPRVPIMPVMPWIYMADICQCTG